MTLQLELPFDELKPKPMDVESLPFYPEAKTDNEKLMNLQRGFYEGNKNALAGVYRLGLEIALKMINVEARSNRHVKSLDPDERAEKAHNAVTYIVSQYLKGKNFKIEKSMTAYIYLRVKHELYYRRKCDAIVDYVDFDEFYKEHGESEEITGV